MAVETQKQKPKQSWRWALLAVVLIMAGYSLYLGGGITRRINTPSTTAATVPLGASEDDTLCPLGPGIALEGPIAVRIQLERSDDIVVSRRYSGTADGTVLRLPALIGMGRGTLALASGRYASFDFGPEGCTEVTELPPEPEGTDAPPHTEAPPDAEAPE